MKKVLSLIMMLLIISSGSSLAQNNRITIVVDGIVINTDVNPVVVDGRTLVPIRAVTESLGADVDWNNATKEITLNFVEYDSVVKMKVDSRNFNVDDYEGVMDVAPKIIDGRTMVPIRFISENLGFTVEWDNETKTVYVSSEYEYSGDIEEAASLLELAIAERYSSETTISFEELQDVDGDPYYLFRVYEDHPDRIVTLGWYYVSMNMDKVYEWDLATDLLEEVPLW